MWQAARTRFFKCRCLTIRQPEDLTLWRPDRRLPPPGLGRAATPIPLAPPPAGTEGSGVLCLSGCQAAAGGGGGPPGSTPSPPGCGGGEALPDSPRKRGSRGRTYLPTTLSGLQLSASCRTEGHWGGAGGSQPAGPWQVPSPGLHSFPASGEVWLRMCSAHNGFWWALSLPQISQFPFSQLPLTTCSPHSHSLLVSHLAVVCVSVCLRRAGPMCFFLCALGTQLAPPQTPQQTKPSRSELDR